MKIIGTSNFNNEAVADTLVAANVSEPYASAIENMLNEKFSGPMAYYYFMKKPDDYVLWRGMEELV